MKLYLTKIPAQFPKRWQQDLKRHYFRYQIRSDRFHSTEPEYNGLSDFLSVDGWVFDVEPNIGHYIKRFSELVGKSRRVFAFDSVPETFELLAANLACLQEINVTLLNVAASDSARDLSMEIPRFESDRANYYVAQLAPGSAALEATARRLAARCSSNR